MAKRIILGESGGPTPVIDWEVAGALAAAHKRGWQVYGMINGLGGLLNADAGPSVVDLTDVDPMAFAFNGPGAGLKTTRINPKPDQYEKMAEHLRRLGIDAVVYIGGNDSADQLLGLSDHYDGVTIHGIKTIDNDLPETHHCPGFGSAALFNATALKHVHSDYSSYGTRSERAPGAPAAGPAHLLPVLIYQVMGRNAGWLAQATGFAKVDPKGEIDPDRPPHVVLCYEHPYDRTEVLDHVERAITRFGQAAVVVQEDLQDRETGQSLVTRYHKELQRGAHDEITHGRPESFSTAVFLAQEIQQDLGPRCAPHNLKTAVFAPQHIQRSCMMSNVDAAEAYQVGAACIEAIESNETRRSVVLHRDGGRTTTGLTDLANLAHQVRHIEPRFFRGLDGPTQEFIDEFIYLIGGPAAIPHYSTRRFTPVPFPPGRG